MEELRGERVPIDDRVRFGGVAVYYVEFLPQSHFSVLLGLCDSQYEPLHHYSFGFANFSAAYMVNLSTF
ncbi:hypothetical protein CFP56_004001 [Quercus suber]|uniref:Uncharacterized protein n=1 Tax=Quercus suber TaxID=58331 RepID=A0AAW0LCB6_QUESU